MVEINSELPVKMLDRNLMVNDYDFVLFHLLETNVDYNRYFVNLRATRPDRKMILDNSAYEYYVNGQTLDWQRYVNVIRYLNPDYYILPDTLMDKTKTLSDVWEFTNKYGKILDHFDSFTQPIAVLQGNSIDDLVECARAYQKTDIVNIAIPFHNSFFRELGKDETTYAGLVPHDRIIQSFASRYNYTSEDQFTDDMWYAIGRIKFMRIFENYGDLYNRFKYIHMLGSHCPYEVCYYCNNDKIKSMDTGYPVKCAMEGYKLFEEPHKPNIIIDDFINKSLDISEYDLIMANMCRFKKTAHL